MSGLKESRRRVTSPDPPVSTFVVRFWREWSAAGPRWRGRIEHVQSSQSATFLSLQGMLGFVLDCGVMADCAKPPDEKGGDDGTGRGDAL
jgi:hypothetical protein